MDDDYEIRSNPSPVSGSPMSSRRENRRITVTVASPATSLPAANSLALALPIQQQARGSNGGSGGSGGREDCWSEGATAVLIDAWGERYLELNRGNLKQKHWKEVADVVNSRDDYTKTPKTDIQCKNRIDTVKKRYKTEKAKISDGGGITTSKWQFFDRLDQLIGPTAKIPNATGTITVGNSNSPLQKVPLGIPVSLHTGGGGGDGGVNQYLPQKQRQQIQLKNRKLQFHQCDLPENSDSPVSSDSYPPEGNERKRTKVMKEKKGGKKRKDWGNAMKEMSKAIIKFGEVYEQTESSKVKQIMEMENQRMQFVKDLELQRMQFFMKIQSEISQLMDHSNNSNDNNNGCNNNNNNNKENNNDGNNNNNNHNNNNSDSE